MREPIFFEIPIYRCEKNKFDIENKIKLQNFTQKCLGVSEKDVNDFFYLKLWYPWKYNEIIGYLKLYIFGNQLRIEHSKVDKKRYRKGINKKKFEDNGKILEKTLSLELSSIQIKELIEKELFYLQKKEFKNYYLDIKTFKTIGSFVNWRELVTKLNAFNHTDLNKTLL